LLLQSADGDCVYSRYLTLLEIWKYNGIIFSSWKSTGNLQSLLEFEIFWFSLRVCTFVVNISYNSCISECISTKYRTVNQYQLILR